MLSAASRIATRPTRSELTRAASPKTTNQTSRLIPITGPRRSEITAIRAPSDSIAAASTEPSARIACPDICDGTAIPSRESTVGATSVEST